MGDHVDDILEEWRRERPDLDPSPMGIFGRVTRVYSLAHRRLDDLLDEHELSAASFDVLANLRRAGPPYRRTPSELAASSMLTSGGMTGRLDKLEAHRLITRVPAESDRRVTHAQLTPQGVALIDKVIEVHLHQEEQMLARLGTRQRTALALALAELERSIVDGGTRV